MACLPKNKTSSSTTTSTNNIPNVNNSSSNNPVKNVIASNSIDDRDFNEVDMSDDFIDPRVQIELEKLNSATDAINKLEVELDEARASFRQLLSESSQRINFLAKKLGTCIEKARPYYEARMIAKEAHAETQKAALRFERANSAHAAAKEMVFLAEEGLQKEGRTFDPAWQEMLNHATMRVNEAERERTFSEQEHRMTSQTYNEAEQKVQQLQKDLKRAIAKSRPYFEMKAQFNQMMEEQKEQVQQLEEQIMYVKQSYAHALHNLEEISDEIHQKRQQKQDRQELGSRDPGVGAESPVPSVPEKDSNNSDINTAINTDDVYLRLPRKIGPLYNATQHTNDSSSKINQVSTCKNREFDQRNVHQVDHGIQTDKVVRSIDQYSTDYSQEDKIQNERISAWVQETGLRSYTANRRASLLNSRENNNHGLAATLFMNVHEDSDMSDAESLNSTDVLTDEQIANLMLDRELEDAYQDIIIGGKPKESTNFKKVETVLSSLVQQHGHLQHCHNNDTISEASPAKLTSKISTNKPKLEHSNNQESKEERFMDTKLTNKIFSSLDKVNPNQNSHPTKQDQINASIQDQYLEKLSEGNIKQASLPSSDVNNQDVPTIHAVANASDPPTVNDSSLKGTDVETLQGTSDKELPGNVTKFKLPNESVNIYNLRSEVSFNKDELNQNCLKSLPTNDISRNKEKPMQEIKVVAVQFTVKETVVTPKMPRAIHLKGKQRSSSIGSQNLSQEARQKENFQSQNLKSRSASFENSFENTLP